MSEQCDHDRAIETGAANEIGLEVGENAVFGYYLASELKPPSGARPVVTAVEKYTLFIWGVRA